MATVYLPSFIQGLSGRLGDVVFRRRGRVTYLSRRPEQSNRPPTPAQLANRARFAAMARARAAKRQQK